MIINFIIIAATVITSIMAWNNADLFYKLKFNPGKDVVKITRK